MSSGVSPRGSEVVTSVQHPGAGDAVRCGTRRDSLAIAHGPALAPPRRRMCGIVGLIHADRDCPVSPRLVREMCEAIRHRGPDDEGAYVDGPVGLGMRRLSIIDLAGGRQPMFNEDRSKVIVFNGEIYNYRDLRRELLRRGHTFTSQGHTETILHLYEEHGPRCVELLRGMFAFASELKALHEALPTERVLDWEALDMYLQLGYIPAPRTPFRDIRKVEPGHTATWHRSRGFATRQYWDLPPPSERKS